MEEYRSLVEDFVLWCGKNHLQPNISKTKELVVHFCQGKRPLIPVTIQGENVEVLKGYKYIGMHINNKLD